MRCTQVAAFTVAAAVFTASGCGEAAKKSSNPAAAASATPSTTQATTANSQRALTSAALISQADAICYQVNAKRASSVITSKRDMVRILPKLAAYERAAVARMANLIPPVSMANDWKLILVNANAVAQETATLAQYANTNPHILSGAPAIKTIVKAQEQLTQTARRDGFKDCAQT
jgi:hypothetical protein